MSTCPDQSTLQALLDDALPAEDEAGLAAHLEVCDACRNHLEALASGNVLQVEQLTSDSGRSTPGTEIHRVIDELQTAVGNTQPSAQGHQATPLDFLTPSDRASCLGLFGTYDILEVIGQGGMGLVLKAHDPSLNRLVVIKLLLPQLATQETARKRFVREAQSAAAVEHDHVVAIHAVDELNAIPYLVMQFVEGQSLQQRIEQSGPLPASDVLRIGEQIALGLAAAHERGLVHRDVKPANILLERETDRVKITDFGLAKAVDDVGLTRSGMIAGTPQYMAPEQVRATKIDHRADLFALGAVLYTACAGRPAFTGDSTYSVLRNVCDETPKSLKEFSPAVPSGLCDVIEKLMQKKADDRYQTAAEVAADLNRESRGLAPLATFESKPTRRGPRRPLRWIAVAVSLAIVLGVLLITRPWRNGIR